MNGTHISMPRGRIALPPHLPAVPVAGAFLAASLFWAAVIAAPAAAAEGVAATAIPRAADGHPDFSGIWESSSGADYDLEPHAGRSDAPPGVGVVAGGLIPYQAVALERRRDNFAARATADRTRLNCYTLGVPRSVYYPAPFQIFQRPRDLTIVGQFGAVRTIHANGTPHPEAGFGFWLGDSRAHWDGDTLVVDVTDFNEETWLDRAGNFHSDALHVVERWTFLDAHTIDYRATIEDPKVFTRPFELGVILNRHRERNFQLVENYCFTQEYDEFYPFPAEQDAGQTHDARSRSAESFASDARSGVRESKP